MDGFTDADVKARTPLYTIWRQPQLMGMTVAGVVDDTTSLQWREGLAAEFARGGHPRFFAMDVSGVDPQNSMSGRFRTAAFVREHLKKLEFAALCLAGAPGPLVVVRATLRVVGMRNIMLCNERRRFNLALEMMRRGHRPTADLADVALALDDGPGARNGP